MITFDQAMGTTVAPQITELETNTLDENDMLNLILQRSEIIRDQEKYKRYIKAANNSADRVMIAKSL